MDIQKPKVKQNVDQPVSTKPGGGASGASFSKIDGEVRAQPKQGKPPAWIIGTRG